MKNWGGFCEEVYVNLIYGERGNVSPGLCINNYYDKFQKVVCY
jgi:hypothetical protein